MNDFLKLPLGIVAHDAGAANHIIAWLKGCNDNAIHVCMEGPAARLWGRSFQTQPNKPISDIDFNQMSMLITGTGWESALEHDARKLARSLGLRSVAVIDHWANYRERFVQNEEEVLPDEIWVTDEYSKRMAESEFPNNKIVQLPNDYLDSMVQEVRDQEQSRKKCTGNNVLYVLEPIRGTWGYSEQQGEFQALDFFVENLSVLQLDGDIKIKLRPHPSDPQGKYDQWLKAQESVQISIDELSSLAQSIAWSDIVVGCETYAMVVALAAGRRVVSSIPPWAPACILPQAEIIRLSGQTTKL